MSNAIKLSSFPTAGFSISRDAKLLFFRFIYLGGGGSPKVRLDEPQDKYASSSVEQRRIPMRGTESLHRWPPFVRNDGIHLRR